MPPEQLRGTESAGEGDPNHSLRCSFCLRPVRGAKDAIAGPGVRICRDCVALCIEIFEDMGQPLYDGPPAD